MQLPKTVLLLVGCLAFLSSAAQVKSLYNYQELSQLFYARQKDSLKKAWACPSIYKEKETQKKYREIWDSRTAFVTSAIEDNSYVYDKDVFGYVDGIVSQIVQANKERFPVVPFLLIDRSSSANAYALGGNIIAVNLGLVSFVRSREELALAIAHELSHNVLTHPENAMQQRAELLTSDEYKKSLNAVLDSKYERLSRLKKILADYSFSRSKHQRYHEGEADSLAILLLKKANISFDAGFFLRLDSADIQYRQPLKNRIKDYFVAYSPTIEDNWTIKRSRGLSTRSYNFKDTSSIADSLRTHPDCEERYERTKKLSDVTRKLTPVPAVIYERTTRMMLWNMFNNMSLTPCLYRILLEKDNGNKDVWFDFMLQNVFTGLFYADRELRRFNAIGIIPKEYVSKEYYELQTLLEQMPRESLEQFCKSFQSASFWNSMPAAEKSFRQLLNILAFDADNSDKNKAAAAKVFIIDNGASPYREFASIFETK
jgi:Zn-dependent protease with chaperone function